VEVVQRVVAVAADTPRQLVIRLLLAAHTPSP